MEQNLNNSQKGWKIGVTVLTIALAIALAGLGGLVGYTKSIEQTADDKAAMIMFDEMAHDWLGAMDLGVGRLYETEILDHGMSPDNDPYIHFKLNYLNDNGEIDGGEPCAAIIYLCKNSYRCEFFDDLGFVPEGEYFEVS